MTYLQFAFRVDAAANNLQVGLLQLTLEPCFGDHASIQPDILPERFLARREFRAICAEIEISMLSIKQLKVLRRLEWHVRLLFYFCHHKRQQLFELHVRDIV